MITIFNPGPRTTKAKVKLLERLACYHSNNIHKKKGVQFFCNTNAKLVTSSEENKLPHSFLGIKSQKFLHESSYDGEQTMMNSCKKILASVFHL